MCERVWQEILTWGIDAVMWQAGNQMQVIVQVSKPTVSSLVTAYSKYLTDMLNMIY